MQNETNQGQKVGSLFLNSFSEMSDFYLKRGRGLKA